MPFGYSTGDVNPESGQQYAVVIFLPDHLDRVVAPLRERYDPDYSVIGSHVSIMFPFQTKKRFDEVSRIIRKTIENQGPIPIEMDSIGDFYPTHPIIYWEVKKNAIIDELYKTLYAELDVSIPHKTYCPHVTVAREISDHRVILVKEKIIPYLFHDVFQATSLDLVAPASSKQWVSIRNFALLG